MSENNRLAGYRRRGRAMKAEHRAFLEPPVALRLLCHCAMVPLGKVGMGDTHLVAGPVS